MRRLLPYGRQLIDNDDIESVVEALRSDFLTTGPLVNTFEEALTDATGAEHAIVCNSGTAALHLAFLALGIDNRHSVIVPTITFLATANAACMVGSEVVFADVDPDTGLMTEEHLRSAMSRATREPGAVVVVHLNGHVAALDRIADITHSNGYKLVEDACHALGTKVYDPTGRLAWQVGDGALADATTFSFHPVKTITTAEGGAVTTRHAHAADRMRCFRNHGMTRRTEEFVNSAAAFDSRNTANPWYYEMHSLGWNYRLSDLQCALGLSQLRKLPFFRERRLALTKRYNEKLQALAQFIRPVGSQLNTEPCLHLYSVLCAFNEIGLDRAGFMRALKARGILTQVHYIPVHWQPYYSKSPNLTNLPDAERYYARQLSLPLYPAMEDADVDRVVSALREIIDERVNDGHDR